VADVGSSFFGQSAFGRLFGIPQRFSGTTATLEAAGEVDDADKTGAGPLATFSVDADPTTVELGPQDATPITSANSGRTKRF
jgi:hypothetical protein